MQMKMFHSRNRQELEKQVNRWLTENPVTLVNCQLTTVLMEDETSYWTENTIALFYVPMQAIGGML